MKEIPCSKITDCVAQLCISSNIYIADDIEKALLDCRHMETSNLATEILDTLIENSRIAREKAMPICQDTGMAVVFIELGQNVFVTGGSLTDAINKGVAKGYDEGYLRKSIVADPIDRINTKDNTPAIIHYNIVEGDTLKITVAPKGFGSENMSRLKMLNPSDGIEGVKDFVIDTVKTAGSNPCPPIIVGVGIGGTMEKSCLIAKQALLRRIGTENKSPFYSAVEKELLQQINSLGIGAGGFGGRTTALAVHINTFPTHIAGLPVAVNIGCHVTRHDSITI